MWFHEISSYVYLDSKGMSYSLGTIEYITLTFILRIILSELALEDIEM
jgi:hypothetical protein